MAKCACKWPDRTFMCANGRRICASCGDDAIQQPAPPFSEARIREIAREEAQSVHLEAMSSRLRAERRRAYSPGETKTDETGHPRRYCLNCNDWHLCSLDKRGKKR